MRGDESIQCLNIRSTDAAAEVDSLDRSCLKGDCAAANKISDFVSTPQEDLL